METQAINDGYWETGYLAGVPRLYPELRFVFRPALVEEGQDFQDRNRQLPAKDYDVKAADFVAKRLQSWDLKDRTGTAMPISAASLLKLKRPLFYRLCGVVFGNEAYDPDPDQASEGAGKDGEERQERDEKNS